MSELDEISLHNTRIAYMQTWSQYGLQFEDALNITEDYLKNPHSRSTAPSPNNPDLSFLEIERLRAENERLRKSNVEAKDYDFPQEKLGEVANKLSHVSVDDDKQRIMEEFKSGSDEILINRPQPSKTATQKITPDFTQMVNPGGLKRTDEEKEIPQKENLKVSDDLEQQRTFGRQIPLRYEDRVKWAEEQVNTSHTPQQIERPVDMTTDSRGYGESGGALPSGTK